MDRISNGPIAVTTNSIIQQAIAQGDYATVRRLLQNGIDIDSTGQFPLDLTPLSAAIAFSRHRLVHLLLELGANVNARNPDGSTALITAARMGHFEFARLVIENGANVNARSWSGDTALVAAASRGDINRARLLLNCGLDLRSRDEFGVSQGGRALAGARMRGDDYMIAILLEAGAEDDDEGGAAVPAKLDPVLPHPPFKHSLSLENPHHTEP